MLDQSHGKKSTLDRKLFTEDCLECFHATVRGNYVDILDEIEDDIIKDVLSSCSDVSTYAKQLCLDSQKTRVEAAVVFLQLALANDVILCKLRESLLHYSAVRFINFKCQTCKDGKSKIGKAVIMPTKKMSFMFQLKKTPTGEVNVRMVKDDSDGSGALCLPGPVRRTMLIRSNSSMNIRTVFTQDLPDRERIVIVGNNGGFNETMLNLIKRKYTTYTLPFSTRNDIDNQTRTKLGECVAYTSPGPHVFLIICDIEECKNLESKIHHLTVCFGEAVKSYILVACIFNDRTKHEATDVVKQLPLPEKGFLLIDETSTKDKHMLDLVQQKMEELKTREQPEYFTNECFKVSESRIRKKMETMRNITDYKVKNLQDQIQQLEHIDWRVEATKETAISLTCCPYRVYEGTLSNK